MTINIEFTEEKPIIYGHSGLHLFSTQPETLDGHKNVIITKDANFLDLYKLFNDIAIFLGNTTEPDPHKYNLRTLPVFGNPNHAENAIIEFDDEGISEFVGYLDHKDISEVTNFLNTNQLNKKEYVEKYFNTLDTQVQETLEMLLDDRVIWELHEYLEPMTEFFNDCLKDSAEVVIIMNP